MSKGQEAKVDNTQALFVSLVNKLAAISSLGGTIRDANDPDKLHVVSVELHDNLIDHFILHTWELDAAGVARVIEAMTGVDILGSSEAESTTTTKPAAATKKAEAPKISLLDQMKTLCADPANVNVVAVKAVLINAGLAADAAGLVTAIDPGSAKAILRSGDFDTAKQALCDCVADDAFDAAMAGLSDGVAASSPPKQEGLTEQEKAAIAAITDKKELVSFLMAPPYNKAKDKVVKAIGKLRAAKVLHPDLLVVQDKVFERILSQMG